MAYALGRRLEYYDQPTVRRIVHDAAAHEYRWSSIILGIVESPAFFDGGRLQTDYSALPVEQHDTPPATDTFNDEILPATGIRTTASQRLRTISCMPFPSPPSTSAAGDP